MTLQIEFELKNLYSSKNKFIKLRVHGHELCLSYASRMTQLDENGVISRRIILKGRIFIYIKISKHILTTE